MRVPPGCDIRHRRFEAALSLRCLSKRAVWESNRTEEYQVREESFPLLNGVWHHHHRDSL